MKEEQYSLHSQKGNLMLNNMVYVKQNYSVSIWLKYYTAFRNHDGIFLVWCKENYNTIDRILCRLFLKYVIYIYTHVCTYVCTYIYVCICLCLYILLCRKTRRISITNGNFWIAELTVIFFCTFFWSWQFFWKWIWFPLIFRRENG